MAVTRGDVEAATLTLGGSPSLARTTMRTCRAHYPGGSKRVHVSIASPFHAAFPKLWVGRHPHCPFRGLLRLHSRYGPHACSTAQGGLCHGAPAGPVARPRRPLATSSIDNSLGGTLLHRCFAPSRRTRVCRRPAHDKSCARIHRRDGPQYPNKRTPTGPSDSSSRSPQISTAGAMVRDRPSHRRRDVPEADQLRLDHQTTGVFPALMIRSLGQPPTRTLPLTQR
jgi:hypothetical protein